MSRVLSNSLLLALCPSAPLSLLLLPSSLPSSYTGVQMLSHPLWFLCPPLPFKSNPPSINPSWCVTFPS